MNYEAGDMNRDGTVDTLDIDTLIDVLVTNGVSPEPIAEAFSTIPEPGGFALLVVGVLAARYVARWPGDTVTG